MTILQLTTERSEGGPTRVVLTGELDISSAAELEEQLVRIEADPPPVLVVDLAGLEFMDSTGLRAIVSADARAREQSRRLVVVRGPAAVDRIFSVTGLDERLELVADPDAVQA